MCKCEICGKKYNRGIYGIHIHHKIKQQQYDKNPEWFEGQGIKQRTHILCYQCHARIHAGLTDKKLLEKYGINRSDYLWKRDKIVLDKCY